MITQKRSSNPHASKGMQDSIIDEVDDENHHSRTHLQSFLKLNEESVNVDIETSNNQSDLRGRQSNAIIEDQIDTLESNNHVAGGVSNTKASQDATAMVQEHKSGIDAH